MNLSTVFPGASPKALRKTVVLALILALAAHGFCFFNLTYSGESVMLNAAKGSASQIASGAFLMPLYWRVRGAISAPLWVRSAEQLLSVADGRSPLRGCSASLRLI